MITHNPLMGVFQISVPLNLYDFGQAAVIFTRFANKRRPYLINELSKSLEEKPLTTPQEFFGRIESIQLEKLVKKPLYQRIDAMEMDGAYKFRYRRPLLRHPSFIDIELFSQDQRLVFISKVKAYVIMFALEADPSLKETLK